MHYNYSYRFKSLKKECIWRTEPIPFHNQGSIPSRFIFLVGVLAVLIILAIHTCSVLRAWKKYTDRCWHLWTSKQTQVEHIIVSIGRHCYTYAYTYVNMHIHCVSWCHCISMYIYVYLCISVFVPVMHINLSIYLYLSLYSSIYQNTASTWFCRWLMGPLPEFVARNRSATSARSAPAQLPMPGAGIPWQSAHG